jgi:hypothetical protein
MIILEKMAETREEFGCSEIVSFGWQYTNRLAVCIICRDISTIELAKKP